MASSTTYIVTSLATPVKDLVGVLTTSQRIAFLKSVNRIITDNVLRTERSRHEVDVDGRLVLTRVFIEAETEESLFEQIKDIVQTYEFLESVNCKLAEVTHEVQNTNCRLFAVYCDNDEKTTLVQIGVHKTQRFPTDEQCGMLFMSGHMSPLCTNSYDLVPKRQVLELYEMYSTQTNDELIGVFEPPKTSTQRRQMKKAIRKCNKQFKKESQ